MTAPPIHAQCSCNTY